MATIMLGPKVLNFFLSHIDNVVACKCAVLAPLPAPTPELQEGAMLAPAPELQVDPE